MALARTGISFQPGVSARRRSQMLPAQTLHFLQGNLMLLGALSLMLHLFTAAWCVFWNCGTEMSKRFYAW